MKKADRLFVTAVSFVFLCIGRALPGTAGDSASAGSGRTAGSPIPSVNVHEGFVNPFAPEGPGAKADSSKKADTARFVEDKTVSPAENAPSAATSAGNAGVESKKSSIDLLMDLSFGVTPSYFKVNSGFYSGKGNTDVLFNIGIIVPFADRFFVEAALRDVRLANTISDSVIDPAGSSYGVHYQESMNFISLAVNAGIKFDLGIFAPYIYVTGEPSYLTSASQFIRRNSFTMFPDSSTYSVSLVRDNESTAQRNRFQLFAGCGAGVEISYGFGVIYLDACAKYAMRQTGYAELSPGQGSSTLVVFPVSLGIRFYL
jgi:hypothetical protein